MISGTSLIEPHGGELIHIFADDERCSKLKEVAMNLKDVVLDDRQLCDFELIATGAFSPLDGFMTQADYEPVLDRMQLGNGIFWPLPVCLGVSETLARNLETGQSVAIRDPEGFLLAVMHVADIWPIDRKKEAKIILGTDNPSHPGVQFIHKIAGDFYIGGRLEVISAPLHFDFKQIRLTPREVRETYKKLGWHRIVGYQTSNPIHRPQFEMTVHAMRHAKANLLINAISGLTKPGDFDHYTRVRCYNKLVDNYPPNAMLLNLLPHTPRQAGPRDALLNAVIAKNYGCSHYIVGHGHANPYENKTRKAFFNDDELRDLVVKHAKQIDMNIIPFKEMVYLSFEDEYRFIDDVPEGTQTISLTQTEIRERIRTGRNIPHWSSFENVIQELRKSYPPPRRQGFTVFMTGLSGAGKSTIAKVIYSKFLEIGERPVTLLDGDIVRRNLSSELNFSKEHRDINIKRIGFVASEITKNRGIAICAPIAPYQTTRDEIRDIIESYGGFIEVHVSTPIEECEKRDRKGIYAKARAGLVKGLTGVDDPYEVPKHPEVRINTTDLTPDEAAQEILLFLSQKGYI